MRRPWRSMRKLGRQLLAGPYLDMDNRIYPAADRYYLILCVYKYFGCFYLGQYRSDCRPGTCKIHSAFLKARIFLYSSLSAACLSACDDLKQFSF